MGIANIRLYASTDCWQSSYNCNPRMQMARPNRLRAPRASAMAPLVRDARLAARIWRARWYLPGGPVPDRVSYAAFFLI